MRGIVVVVAIMWLFSCGDKRNYTLECLDTVGRRTCITGSIKYNAEARECKCTTKHRGEIEWDIRPE